MTDDQAAKVIAVMMGAFPFMSMPPQTIELYESSILDLDYAVADAAVRRLILTAKKPPLIAEIREAAVSVLGGDTRSGAEAWKDVLAAVHRYGVGQIPVFDDPLVDYAVKSVGWRSICLAPEIDPAPRAKFADAYNSAVARVRSNAALSPGAVAKELPRGGEAKRLPFGDVLARIGAGDPDGG